MWQYSTTIPRPSEAEAAAEDTADATNDGDDEGDPVASDILTISNTPPVLDFVTIVPTEPTVDDVLICNYGGYYDDDGYSQYVYGGDYHEHHCEFLCYPRRWR